MKSKIKIGKVNCKPFKAQDGEEINYYWYRGERLHDGVTLEFGSMQEYEKDETVDVELEKIELANGKFRYKEPTKFEA